MSKYRGFKEISNFIYLLKSRNFFRVIYKFKAWFLCPAMNKDEKKLYTLIGKRLTGLRKKAGYTSQEIFAYDADIPRALYGRYEKGSNLTMYSLFKILKFHGMTYKAFFSKGFEGLGDLSKGAFAGYGKPKPRVKKLKRKR